MLGLMVGGRMSGVRIVRTASRQGLFRCRGAILPGLQLPAPAVPIVPLGLFLIPERPVVALDAEQVAQKNPADQEQGGSRKES